MKVSKIICSICAMGSFLGFSCYAMDDQKIRPGSDGHGIKPRDIIERTDVPTENVEVSSSEEIQSS